MKETAKSDEEIIKEKILEELLVKDIPASFPEYTDNEYALNRSYADSEARRDLREMTCLTIDGPNARELDDAISLMTTEKGYRLGVHIADVTAYVQDGTPLSQEAEKRGTTIYLPGQTIPMFPPAISERLCSLTADSDKKAVSMFIEFDAEGNILGYEVCRSVIRSKVRGIYSEVNLILENTAESELIRKYEAVIEEIMNMKKFAALLRAKREHCGAGTEAYRDVKYTFKDGMLELSVCGATEADRIICEFMVAANTCMAYYFAENNLPGIYRVQRNISLNAGYSTEQQNHESLAICGGYMRFTSPIRRAADYRIHQVLTAFLDGESAESIKSKYLEKMTAYCTEAQALEDRARQLEHKILNECHMLYFGRREDDTFRGVVISASRDNEYSVIELQSYSIRVFGAFELAKYTGQVFMIKVSPDLERKCLLVRRIERTAVA